MDGDLVNWASLEIQIRSLVDAVERTGKNGGVREMLLPTRSIASDT